MTATVTFLNPVMKNQNGFSWPSRRFENVDSIHHPAQGWVRLLMSDGQSVEYSQNAILSIELDPVGSVRP
jgi:hypothetical protein